MPRYEKTGLMRSAQRRRRSTLYSSADAALDALTGAVLVLLGARLAAESR